jgi:hypothetical protein
MLKLSGPLFLMLATSLGCTQADRLTKQVFSSLDTHESLIGALTQTLEQMADTLSAVKDTSSAQSQAAAFEDAANDLRDYVDRIRKLPLLRDQQMMKRIDANFSGRARDASRRLGVEMRRVSADASLKTPLADSLAKVQSAFWDLQFAQLEAWKREEGDEWLKAMQEKTGVPGAPLVVPPAAVPSAATSPAATSPATRSRSEPGRKLYPKAIPAIEEGKRFP